MKHPKPPPLRKALEKQRMERLKNVPVGPSCERTGVHDVNITTGICSFCKKKPTG